MKKIIIYLTIASLLNLVGCYNQQQMTPEKYNFDENEDLQVTTKDTTYSLTARDYYYNRDTLFATLSQAKYENDHWVRYKSITPIPVKEMEKLEVEKADVATTTWIVAGVLLIGAGIIVIIETNEKFSEMERN